MKIRSDFVTNSSSSSFIIDSKDINLQDLIMGPIKDLYSYLNEDYEENIPETEDAYKKLLFSFIENEDSNIGVFYKIGVEIIDDHNLSESQIKKDNYYYEVSNNSYIRFDIGDIERIFSNKHKLNYIVGYCD